MSLRLNEQLGSKFESNQSGSDFLPLVMMRSSIKMKSTAESNRFPLPPRRPQYRNVDIVDMKLDKAKA